MSNIEELTRESVLEELFKSWDYGNLGLFIGAGFSKTVTKDEKNQALGWLDLIKNISQKLDLEMPDDKELVGVSLPELASKMCKKLQIARIDYNEDFTYEDAKSEFKQCICSMTNWIASNSAIEEFRQPLLDLKPSWIITTNYDLLLESILFGKCQSLHPKNYLSAKRGIIPIYHIHGIRTNKESIIITHDDYIPLFRPNEYRQVKLAITMRESTTLVLGYALGDTNVLSALDWSKNIYNEINEYPHEIIQAIRVESPEDKPYRDENNNIILEIESIESFITELLEYISFKKDETCILYGELQAEINSLDLEDTFSRFKNNFEFRKGLLLKASQYEYVMIESYIKFLEQTLSKIWYVTSDNGNFRAYNDYLNILLDIGIYYDYEKISPKLFRLLAESLEVVLQYITDESSWRKRTYRVGTSFSATNTWWQKSIDIPQKMKLELSEYASQNNLVTLERELKLF